MKKIGIVIICMLLLTGCGGKNKGQPKKVTNLDFDDAFYKVYEPYQKGKGNNYVVDNALSNYDLTEVENTLMRISSSYFPVKNTFYQEGQYLTEENLEELLSDKKLNKLSNIDINGITIKPAYISYIHEQNYLSGSGELKGISLALVLNPYQKYTNTYGTYQYKEIDRNQLIDYGKEKAKDVIAYLRKNEKLKDTQIIVGLYIQSNPSDVLPGNFEYVGATTNHEITFLQVHYQYQYLDSDYAMKHDIDAYNVYSNLKRKVNEQFQNVYPSAKGLYVDSRLNHLEITLTTSYLSRSELMLLDQLVAREIGNFNSNITVKIYTKENNIITSLVVKEKNSTKSNAYIMK